MKKLNFWGLVSLAISVIRLWKEHRDELQEIFEDLKELISGIKNGTYGKANIEILKEIRLGGGKTKRSVILAKK